MPKPKLKFYCLKTKKSFTTDDYGLQQKKKKNRTFLYAITTHLKQKCVRILSKAQYDKIKSSEKNGKKKKK